MLCADDYEAALLAELKPNDLLLLGLAEHEGRKTFGKVIPSLIEKSPRATLVIARGDEAGLPLTRLPRWFSRGRD